MSRGVWKSLPLLALLSATGCRPAVPTTRPASENEPARLRVLCSFLPVYLFTVNVVGDAEGVSVHMLLPASSGCPHHYSVSARDAKRIAEADIMILHGGIDDHLRDAARRLGSDARLITASSERPEDRPARSHGRHEREGRHGHGYDGTGDRHLWVSPRRAIDQVRVIVSGLCQADPVRAALYRRHGEAYVARLAALKKEVDELAVRLQGQRVASVQTVLAPLVEDLGLKIAAAIAPSTSAEPSPRDLARMIETIHTRGAVAVLCETRHGAALARTIAEEAGIPYLELDSVATGPAAPVATYYEDTMRRNLSKLQEALGS